jgi:hypothetical protein
MINQKRTSKIEVRVYLVKTNDERNGSRAANEETG